MKDFFAEETLEGENQYECTQCNGYTNASKKLDIREAPLNLIINLKKFDQFGAKIKSGLDYPNQFNLNDYVYKMEKTTKKGNNLTYELYAVINHEGDHSHWGHYNWYVKNLDGNWYNCDDSKIKKFNGSNTKDLDKAYILFYRLADSWRQNKLTPRKISNVSTECDQDEETKPTKYKMKTRFNRKRQTQWNKSIVGGKLRNQIVKKRVRKCTLKVVSSAISDISDWTSSTSKRFKIGEGDDLDISSEISFEIA
jgi:hypothetical protein